MSYQFELRHLRYFLAVAEDLHFRKAAERLYISQPGLSKQIKELEAGIGLQLFNRHNRKVELTEAGAFLQLELKRHLKELDQLVQHAKALNDGLQGNLKLGYVGSAMQQVIPDLLLAFRNQNPNIHFSFKEMDNQEQIEGLLSQDIDIGFVRLERVPRGIEIYPLLDEPFCLLLPENHPINADNFKDLSQLKEASFILFDSKYSPSYYEKVLQIFDDSGFSPIVTHSTIHASSIYKLVEHNFGISIIPKSLQLTAAEGVKFIELNAIHQRTVLSAAWANTNRNPILNNILRLIKNNSN